jgi:predicted transcriptional regulator
MTRHKFDVLLSLFEITSINDECTKFGVIIPSIQKSVSLDDSLILKHLLALNEEGYIKMKGTDSDLFTITDKGCDKAKEWKETKMMKRRWLS